MDTNIPAESLKKTICYYYLLAYCPPANISELKKAAQPLRKNVAEQAGMKMTDYFKKAAPGVSQHIVAFHQNTRDPDGEWVEELASRVSVADKSPENAEAFQVMLGLVSRLPGRAKPENRLHRRRGCRFCAAPCHYGYFSLVSEPRFGVLQGFLEHELQNPLEDKKPVMAVKSFALKHIVETLGTDSGAIHIHHEHLANLAYCLLALATAKSRLPVPEKQLGLFQQANQYFSRARTPVAV
ncbi:MAG: hypothetical protein ISS57_07310 [Anaerolineales bacterium]|nr:hypothetical protein [Anaerolineales bacterium]